MVSMTRISVSRLEYYESRELYQEKGALLIYYTGAAAEKLGFKGHPKRGDVLKLLDGFDPGGQAVVQNAGSSKRHKGVEWAVTMPKSVAVFMSQSDRRTAEKVMECHRAAIEVMVQCAQEELYLARCGKGGIIREHGTLAAVCYEHLTSRAGDISPHTHVLIPSVVVRENGKGTVALHSHEMFLNKMLLGNVYRAELAHQLETRLGLKTEKVERWFELEGVSKGVRDQFSKRRKQIEKALAAGRWGSARAAAIATLVTRPNKTDIPTEKLFELWRHEGRKVGFGPTQAAALLGQCQRLTSEKRRCRKAIEEAVELLTTNRSFFSKQDLIKYAAEGAQGRGVSGRRVIDEVTKLVTQSPEFVQVGEHRNVPVYTTRAIQKQELQMREDIRAIMDRKGPGLSQQVVQDTLAKYTQPSKAPSKLRSLMKPQSLNAEQLQALKHMLEDNVCCISGFAGTGKSTSARALRIAAEREGLRVVGMALGGKQAQSLEASSGIRSDTIHKTLAELNVSTGQALKHHGRQLVRAARGKKTFQLPTDRWDRWTVVVIDEAATAPVNLLAEVIKKAREANARVVLMGDYDQCGAIGREGAFKAICQVAGHVTLTQIERQKEDWAKAAVKAFAEGRAQEALGEFAKRGFVTIAGNRHKAHEALIADWSKKGLESPERHLMLASTNSEVNELNRMAQTARRKGGHLRAEGLPVGKVDYYPNDRILFTKNSRLLGVKNGTLGTIKSVDFERRALDVRLDDGKKVWISTRDYADFQLGYALTVTRAQGTTVDHAYVVAGGKFQDRHQAYVMASRARWSTRFYTDRFEAGKELEGLVAQFTKSSRQSLATEVARDKQGKSITWSIDRAG